MASSAEHRRVNRAAVAVTGVMGVGVLGAAVAACKFFDVEPPRADASVAAPGTEAGAAPLAAGFLSLAEAMKACGLVLSCPLHLGVSIQLSHLISVDSTSYRHCVDALAGPVDPERNVALTRSRLGCVARAATCDQAMSCLFYQQREGREVRCEGKADIEAFCIEDGGAVLTCLPGSSTITPCDHEGLPGRARCVLFGDDRGRRGICAVDDPCPPTSSCDGTVVDHCAAGIHTRQDCAMFGLACSASGECIGPPCQDRSLTACSSSTTQYVCGLSTAALNECARIGRRCEKRNVAVACVGDDDECSVFDDPQVDRCGPDDTIELCVGGRKLVSSCADVGLRCRPPEGVRTAACVPR